MKGLLNITKTGSALIFALLLACVLNMFGMPAPSAVALSVGGAAALSFVPMPQGAMEPVLLQLWENGLINVFRHANTWLEKVPSKNNWVGNNAINLSEIGVDPEVLINNTSYPIKSARREDGQTIIALDKFDTENTIITDDELYGIPYDKEGSVVRQHREVLEVKTGNKGLHNIAPTSHTANTPIVNTTGADNGNSRKRLKNIDIINLKTYYDAICPNDGNRILVLCTDHVNDLLFDESQNSFRDQYNKRETGLIAANYYGFRIYENYYNPTFDGSNVKRAFEATAAGTDRNASIAFYAPRAAKAMGSVKYYKSLAQDDPENRSTKLGARMYHTVINTQVAGFGAIVSASV